MGQLITNLICKLFTPDRVTTSTVSIWASCLNHEALDDAMEDHIVIITIFGMSCKILYCFGALTRKEVAVNFAF